MPKHGAKCARFLTKRRGLERTVFERENTLETNLATVKGAHQGLLGGVAGRHELPVVEGLDERVSEHAAEPPLLPPSHDHLVLPLDHTPPVDEPVHLLELGDSP